MAEIAFVLWAVCLLGPAQRKTVKSVARQPDYLVTPVFSLECTPPQASPRFDQVTGQDARSRAFLTGTDDALAGFVSHRKTGVCV
jgi:hypothetical protein